MFTKTDISIYLMLCLSFFITAGITAQVPEWDTVIAVNHDQRLETRDVVIDKEGNTIIVGFKGTTYSHGESFIQKYNKDKELVWEQSFPHAYVRDMDVDKDGNIYFGGAFRSYELQIGPFTLIHTGNYEGAGGSNYSLWRDIFIAKLDGVTGNVEWAKSNQYHRESDEKPENCKIGRFGGIGTDPSWHKEQIHDLKCDTLGNVYITGYSSSAAIAFDDKIVESAWGIDNRDNEAYNCTPDDTKDPCGSVGKFKFFFLTKFSQETGAVDWVKADEGTQLYQYNDRAGCSAPEHEPYGIEGTNMTISPAGNIYVSFKFNGKDIEFGNGTSLDNGAIEAATGIVKYNTNGTAQWAQKGPAGPLSFDNNYRELIAAYSESDETSTQHTLTKYDPSSGKQFHTFIFPENSGESNINAICVDDSSNIYLAGVFSDRLDFEQAIKRDQEGENQKDTFSLESTGHTASMILKYDNNLDALWGTNVENLSLSGENAAYGIAVSEGKITVTGIYGQGGQHYFGNELHLIGSEELQGYVTVIDQQPMISVHFRKMTANAATMPTHFELWGEEYDGEEFTSKSFIIEAKEYDDPSKINARYGEFSPTLKELVDIKDLYILKDGKLLGKTTFKYNVKNASAGRKKDAYVIMHDDLTRYKNHPIEADNKKWKYKEKYKYDFSKKIGINDNGESTNGGDFYQTTLFIPPGNKKKNGFILEGKNAKELLKGTPAIMVHGYTGSDQYWGDDIDLVESEEEDLTGKSDYLYTSYTARIQEELGDAYKVWEFIYPSDQSWLESSYLFGKSLEMMLKEFYTESTKVSIVAHSMGGLVTRAYIEEHNENYKTVSTNKTTFKYKENIKNVLFLGTPHHGAFSGNRLYWGIFMPDFVGGLVKDDYAPAARLLGAGHEAYSRLNDRPTLNNNGVSYFQISGTTYRGLMPGAEALGLEAQLFTESFKNEDGAVAISSGNLLKFGVPLGLVNNFSHLHLNKPENKDNPLTETQMQLIPTVAKEFITNSTVQSTNLFRWYGTTNATMEDELGYPDSRDNVKLNIATPMVTFNDMETGQIWKPRGGKPLRFKLEVQSFQGIEDPVAILKKEIVEDPLKYNAAGTYLYYGANNLFWNKVESRGEKYQKDNFKNEFTGFYPYRIGKGGPWNLFPDALNLKDKILYSTVLKPLKEAKDAYDKFERAKPDRFFNPLSLNTKEFIHGKGLGWHLPNFQKLDLQVYFEFTIKRRPLDKPVRFFHDTNNLIKLERSQTTYNNIRVSKSARYLLNALQHLHHHYLDYIFDLTEGDFSRGGNLLANEGTPSFTAKSRRTVEKHNWIDCNTNSSSFVLEYGDNPGPTFQLKDPRGQIISAQDKDEESIFYFHNPELKIKVFSINEPMAGKWQVLVDGQTTFSNEDYNLSFPMDVENLNVTTIRDTTVAAFTHIFEDSIILQTTLEDLSVPINGMSVLADAYSEYGTNETIEFKDDGVGADSLAGDNLFTAIFHPDTTGAYTIVTDIIGQMNGCNFIRESAIDVVSLPTEEVSADCESLSLDMSVYVGHRPSLTTRATGGTAPYVYTSNLPRIFDNQFLVGCTRHSDIVATVTDANGCSVTDTLFNINTYPAGDIEYTISNDTIHFRLENQEHINFISRWSTDIPGGILPNTFASAALPPPGRYTISVEAPGHCSDGNMSRWIEIEAEDSGAPTCENGIEQNINLSTQAQIDKFEEYYGCSECSYIKGDLIINGADIVDLSGLSFLTEVTGNIFIENCPLLTSLEGLENITTIGSVLKLKDLNALTSLTGLNGAAIKTIGKNLVIRNNSQLRDLSALSGIQTIKGHLLVGNNLRLSNFKGLEKLTNVDKNVIIENHPALSDCSVLCTLFYEGTVGNKIIMRNNKGGCNNPTQVLKSCDRIPSECGTYSNYSYRLEGHKVYLTATTSEDANALYLWKLEDGTFHLSDSPTFSYVFSKSGTYSVNMKVIGSCVAGITKTIIIPETTVSENTLQLCSDGIDNDGDGLIDEEDTLDCACLRGENITAGFDFTIAGNTLSLKDISTGEIVDRKWMSSFAIVDGKIDLPASGSFNICLEVSNDCGVTNQFCQTISTGSVCDEFSQPMTAESRSSTKPKTTSADLMQTLGTASPNPTTGSVVIDFDLPKASKVTLQLFSLSGQQSAIYLNKVPYTSGKHQQEISLSHLPSGMYLMQFRTADAIWTEKIVKVDY